VAGEQFADLLECRDQVGRGHRQWHVFMQWALAGETGVDADRAGDAYAPYAPDLSGLNDVEQAAERFPCALNGLVRTGWPGHGACEMHDAGDLVTCTDVEQRRQIGDIGLFHLRLGEVGRYPGGSSLDQHAAFAQVEQGLRGVRADKPETAGNQDHRTTPFCRHADYQ
jgi:hypothetical protein